MKHWQRMALRLREQAIFWLHESERAISAAVKAVRQRADGGPFDPEFIRSTLTTLSAHQQNKRICEERINTANMILDAGKGDVDDKTD